MISYDLFIKSINQQICETSIPQVHVWQDALAFLQIYKRWQDEQQEKSAAANFVRYAVNVMSNTAERALNNANKDTKVQGLGINLILTLELPVPEFAMVFLHYCNKYLIRIQFIIYFVMVWKY